MGRTLSMCVLISNFSDVTFGKRLLERKIQHLNCVYVHSLLLHCLFCVELLTIIVFTCSGGKTYLNVIMFHFRFQVLLPHQ